MDAFSLIIPLITAIMSLSLGVLLFSIKIPKNKDLDSYKISRKVMACVYLSLGIVNIGQMFVGNSQNLDAFFFLTRSGVYIIVASFQALLLTYSLIILIDTYFVTRKKIIIQLIPVTLLSVLTIAGFFTNNMSYLKRIIGAFSIYYVFKLISYTRLFFSKEKCFMAESKNFFSENEARRIAWVKRAFLSSLFIGVWAFSIVLFPRAVVLEQIFSIVCIGFYLYFGIHYINYVQDFFLLMPIIVPEDVLVPEDEFSISGSNNDLKMKLEEWVERKAFTEKGITINELAEQVNSNRTYISSYINTHEKVNFNRWLNALRIKEAQKEMELNPERTLNELAFSVGYTDQSCFSRQFKSIVGQTPACWKKEKMQ